MQLSDFPKADHELTDAEILTLYGEILRVGISAFRVDPWFIVDMAEAGARSKLVQRRVNEQSEPAPVTEQPITRTVRIRKSAKIRPEIREQVMCLHAAGLTQREIGQQVGRSQGTVSWYIRSSVKNSA